MYIIMDKTSLSTIMVDPRKTYYVICNWSTSPRFQFLFRVHSCLVVGATYYARSGKKESYYFLFISACLPGANTGAVGWLHQKGWVWFLKIRRYLKLEDERQ